jgi:hypothetical protein
MEDIVRYLIIGTGIIYMFFSVKKIIFNKNTTCNSCGKNSTCNKKTCSSDISDLSPLEKKTIKDIKLAYKN